MEHNELNTADQHAYRKNNSTSTALVHMTKQWFRSLDQSALVGVLLLDFKEAFDVVDHEILFLKLCHYGFDGLSLEWLQSYLTDRKQITNINVSFSQPYLVEYGGPQGSCLGPLLFLM